MRLAGNTYAADCCWGTKTFKSIQVVLVVDVGHAGSTIFCTSIRTVCMSVVVQCLFVWCDGDVAEALSREVSNNIIIAHGNPPAGFPEYLLSPRMGTLFTASVAQRILWCLFYNKQST